MMNRRGFTLVELLATIIILAIVVGLASYSIVSIMKTAKEKNYNLLIKNINDAAELYYQECKYGKLTNNSICTNFTITLGELVDYGYLKGNETETDDRYTIVDPRTDDSLSDCEITVSYVGDKIHVTGNSGSPCPQSYDS